MERTWQAMCGRRIGAGFHSGLLWIALGVTLLTGCPESAKKPRVAPRFGPDVVDSDAPQEFTQTASGLKYRILRKSDGHRPAESATIRVHYRGWLDDGTEFENSYSRGVSTQFRMRDNIAGWREGLQLIGRGGMIELEVPPELGYGAQRKDGIPPNSTLHFQVELLDVN